VIKREALEATINLMPSETMVWIDEAYIDYAGSKHSLSRFAAGRANVVICKSLSKVLALSGLRVAYLVGSQALINRLKTITPPWSLSLPAQLVLIEALRDHRYYEQCYAQTHQLRERLSTDLKAAGFSVLNSTANFLLVDYPRTLPTAEEFLSLCSKRHLLLRNVRSMGKMTSDHSFRVAVKDAVTNSRIIQILKEIKEQCLL
jgi:histidinol-phosphate/aromatic aminotransferase/cobyric acid decarboxylase-like protein